MIKTNFIMQGVTKSVAAPYLYFYAKGQIPDLLLISIRFALHSHSKLILTTSEELACQLPAYLTNDKNLTIDLVEEKTIYEDPIIISYMSLINRGLINSNHPPTEIHCIYRWIALAQVMRRLGLERAFAFDWDTILFPSSHELVTSISDRLVMHLDNCDYDHPIFILCPHAAIVDVSSINMYLEYTHKYLDMANSRNFLRSYPDLPRYFSDIPPWSSVISRILQKNTNLLSWNDYAYPLGMYCCSNIRDNGGSLEPVCKEYFIEDKKYNFLPDGKKSLTIHDYQVKNGHIQLRGRRKTIESFETWNIPWIHFSGVEGKYIFFKYFYTDLLTTM